MLVKTNGYKGICNPRKFACYAGVAPFSQRSGTSINKKTRASHLADKTMKRLLHMAAMRAIQLENDLKKYYIRKVNQRENKMLVLNAERNKIIHRYHCYAGRFFFLFVALWTSNTCESKLSTCNVHHNETYRRTFWFTIISNSFDQEFMSCYKLSSFS